MSSRLQTKYVKEQGPKACAVNHSAQLLLYEKDNFEKGLSIFWLWSVLGQNMTHIWPDLKLTQKT